MLSREDMMEIVRRMCEDTEPDMTEEELQQMLEAELAKDKDEMDMSLVKELLLTLEEGATQQEQEEALQRVLARLRSRRKLPAALRAMGRIAVTILVILGLLTVTYKTAEALNWEFLLRLLNPGAETFTLYTGETPGQDGSGNAPQETAPGEVLYGDELKPGEPAMYASPDEIPGMMRGYPVRPQGMPERMTYLQGSAFCDDLSTTVTHVFLDGQNTCIFTMMIVHADVDASSMEYEKTTAEVTQLQIAGCDLTYYFNSDDANIYASWTRDQAQYSVFGVLTAEELMRIVEATMSR